MSISHLKAQVITLLRALLPELEANSFVIACSIESDRTQLDLLIAKILEHHPHHILALILKREIQTIPAEADEPLTMTRPHKKTRGPYESKTLPPLPEFKNSPFLKPLCAVGQESPPLKPLSEDAPAKESVARVTEGNPGSLLNEANDKIKQKAYPEAEQLLYEAHALLTSNPESEESLIKELDQMLHLLSSTYLMTKGSDFSRPFCLIAKIISPLNLIPFVRHFYYINLLKCQFELGHFQDAEKTIIAGTDLVMQKHSDLSYKMCIQQLYSGIISLVGKLFNDAVVSSSTQKMERYDYTKHLLETYVDPKLVCTFMDNPYPFLYFLSLGRTYTMTKEFEKAEKALYEASTYVSYRNAKSIRQLDSAQHALADAQGKGVKLFYYQQRTKTNNPCSHFVRNEEPFVPDSVTSQEGGTTPSFKSSTILNR